MGWLATNARVLMDAGVSFLFIMLMPNAFASYAAPWCSDKVSSELPFTVGYFGSRASLV